MSLKGVLGNKIRDEPIRAKLQGNNRVNQEGSMDRQHLIKNKLKKTKCGYYDFSLHRYPCINESGRRKTRQLN